AVFEPVGTSPAGTAAFVKTDGTSSGTWKGSYGADGYNVATNPTAYPAYAQVRLFNDVSFVWAGSTTDTRALQQPGGTTNREAVTWFNPSSFTIDVNVTDGNTHAVALYLLDWDSANRAEKIDVLDANSGGVLDTQTVSSFSDGKYLQWNVGGH